MERWPYHKLATWSLETWFNMTLLQNGNMSLSTTWHYHNEKMWNNITWFLYNHKYDLIAERKCDNNLNWLVTGFSKDFFFYKNDYLLTWHIDKYFYWHDTVINTHSKLGLRTQRDVPTCHGISIKKKYGDIKDSFVPKWAWHIWEYMAAQWVEGPSVHPSTQQW